MNMAAAFSGSSDSGGVTPLTRIDSSGGVESPQVKERSLHNDLVIHLS